MRRPLNGGARASHNSYKKRHARLFIVYSLLWSVFRIGRNGAVVQMLFSFRAGFVASKYCFCVVLNGSVVDCCVSSRANISVWDARSAMMMAVS